jgi:hypothetical protein
MNRPSYYILSCEVVCCQLSHYFLQKMWDQKLKVLRCASSSLHQHLYFFTRLCQYIPPYDTGTCMWQFYITQMMTVCPTTVVSKSLLGDDHSDVFQILSLFPIDVCFPGVRKRWVNWQSSVQWKRWSPTGSPMQRETEKHILYINRSTNKQALSSFHKRRFFLTLWNVRW